MKYPNISSTFFLKKKYNRLTNININYLSDYDKNTIFVVRLGIRKKQMGDTTITAVSPIITNTFPIQQTSSSLS